MELYGLKIKLFLLRQDDGANPESFYDFSDNVQVGFGQTLNLDDTIDTMNLSTIVGTLAGDDTVMIVMRDTNAAATLCGEIKSLLN